MTENKDSKNPIAQDNTTNELSEKDVASVSGGNFIPPNKTTSFPKTPNELSQHELGSVSGGAVADPAFAIKNKNFIPQDNTPNELSEHELGSVSGGGVVTDVLETTNNLADNVIKTVI